MPDDLDASADLRALMIAMGVAARPASRPLAGAATAQLTPTPDVAEIATRRVHRLGGRVVEEERAA